jgi:lysophospholipase L1-like esterase
MACVLAAAGSGHGEDLGEVPAGAPRLAENERVRVLLIGDSTVCDFPPDRDMQGWGQALPHFFASTVSFLNAAASGRSSKSFRNEGLWEKALTFQPDFVFIQFGHNDQPAKGPERATDPGTEYRDNLRRYIREARAIGAQPIVVTSVARRTFHGDRIATNLTPWVEAAKAVAAEENVPVIDLHAKSIALYEKLGPAGVTAINSGGTDKTHFSPEGARRIAELVVEELPGKVPGLAACRKPLPE